jgi:phosphatidylglycerophosphatase GEP4
MRYFGEQPDSGVTSPSQVAIIGDRLLTDVMLANTMGSYGVWIRDGVKESGKPLSLVGVYHF